MPSLLIVLFLSTGHYSAEDILPLSSTQHLRLNSDSNSSVKPLRFAVRVSHPVLYHGPSDMLTLKHPSECMISLQCHFS